jgi:tRNA pseudouridine38-40 synthase
MRIALGIEYDGTAYNGWQRQRTGVGVQSRVEKALSLVANESIELTCAGRTDSGVHASGQVVHFDTSSERSDHGWLLGANCNMPDDINVGWAKHVDGEFSARFSAIARTYRYLILNRLPRSALYARRAWWVHQPLDEQSMHAAAQELVGRHDFSAFRAAGCQASTPNREITSIAVQRDGNWVSIEVTANAFLQHMVRNITGSLVAIGCGDESVDWLAEVLKSKDRKRGGIAAPPHGLTLTHVHYPAKFNLPVNPGEGIA